MRVSIILVVLRLIPLAAQSTAYKIEKAGCAITIDDAKFFDLEYFTKSNGEYNLTVPPISGDPNHTLLFNVCGKTSACSYSNSMASKYYIVPQTCVSIASNNPESGIDVNFSDGMKYTDFNTTAVELKYKFNNSVGGVSVLLAMICDTNFKDDPRVVLMSTGTTANYTVKFMHSKCCTKINISWLWNFVYEYYALFGVGLILIGFLMAFLGGKILQVMIVASVGLLFMCVATGLIFKYIVTGNVSDSIKFGIFCGSACVGVFLGFMCIKFIKLGIFLVGAYCGFFPGMILYQLIFFRIAPESEYGLYITLLCTSIISGLLCLWLTKHAIIVCTAFGGAYMMTRGASLFIGSFVNEFLLYAMVRDGDFSDVPTTMMIYIGAIVLLTVTGVLIQEKIVKPEPVPEAKKPLV